MKHAELIDAFLKAPLPLERCLQSAYPAGLLDFRPALEGAWTIREHLLHLVEDELHAFLRYRFAIAEPGTQIVAFDEERWTADLDYAHQPLTASWQLLKILRSIAASHLSTVDQSVWDRAWFEHPVAGRINLERWLQIFTQHVYDHEVYIKRNEELWKGQKPQ